MNCGKDKSAVARNCFNREPSIVKRESSNRIVKILKGL